MTPQIPKLRFPEFKGEWELKKFGEIFTFRTTNSFSRDNLNYEYGSVRNIHYGDIHTKFKTQFNLKNELVPFINEDVNIAKIPVDNYCKVGDLVIADASEDYADIGKSIEIRNLNNEKTLAGLHTFLARPDLLEMSLGFNGFIMQSRSIRLQIMTIAQGTKVLSISTGRLSTIELNLPTLPEQTKIANFLTAIDTKIQQLTQKKALLEEYKKGLMQQLFTQQIRFKDENGEDYPDWEEKKLGDVVEFISTNSFSRSLLNYDEGTVKNIHYGDIHTKFKANFNIDNENVPFINNDVDLSKIADACYCKEGDLIIADASEDYADIGKSIEVINIGGQKLLAGLHTYIARDKNQNTVLGFKGYLMQTHGVRVQMMTAATGISVLGISKGNLSKLEIKLPIKEEQSKIANFLTAIDTKIQTVTMQIEQTQAYKKGLLQQMFI